MNKDVYGEVHVASPFICRASGASEETTVESVSWSVGAAGGTAVVEFTVPSSAAIDGADEAFHHEQKMTYRVIHPFAEESRCAYEPIGGHGCSARHLEVDCGAIALSFVTADLESFRDVVINFKPMSDDMSPQRFTQSKPDSATGSPVFVDRDELTVRQREALEVAREMGYFEHPREVNATKAAVALDISRSTFTEHLSAAQSRLLDTILDV